MRVYSIFHIKPKHQSFIYGRERLLFELINGVKTNQNNFYPSQELAYLCETLPVDDIETSIEKHLHTSFSAINIKNHEIYLSNQFKGDLHIEIQPYYLNVYCIGSRMLELDLFATLSKISSGFIGFNKGEMECGWLKPPKFSVLAES
ncbi:sporulation inhibitor of replication protein SirA [Rummeliibacillus stabekisii]|uniref:sporulation inhibitor of replication protein SirA n=1 Tax=Rummeliibacillus TaxID=648802 RepID=UPI00123948D0|nr:MULTISPECIES: sporulation inhibitor of replication protein SirA [Rummeliibacillus]MCM3315913.1 sporulation inhibitor of replication protein SirA [Rummeliibacillus stabekisii]